MKGKRSIVMAVALLLGAGSFRRCRGASVRRLRSPMDPGSLTT